MTASRVLPKIDFLDANSLNEKLTTINCYILHIKTYRIHNPVGLGVERRYHAPSVDSHGCILTHNPPYIIRRTLFETKRRTFINIAKCTLGTICLNVFRECYLSCFPSLGGGFEFPQADRRELVLSRRSAGADG